MPPIIVNLTFSLLVCMICYNHPLISSLPMNRDYVHSSEVSDYKIPISIRSEKNTPNPLRIIFPSFIKSNNRTLYIEEGKEIGSFLASAFIYDNLNAVWNLSVNSRYFRLRHSYGKTWAIHTAHALDRENQSFHLLNITARPYSNSKYNRDTVFWQHIIIEIIDINDNVPQFNMSLPYIIEKAVGSLYRNGEIAHITAFDLDSDVNGKIVYSLDNYNDLFKIGVDSGRLFSLTNLRSGSARYDIIIRATDRGTPPLSNSIVLTLRLVEDRWSLYRLYRYHITIGLTVIMMSCVCFIMTCLIGHRFFRRRWAMRNKLRLSVVPFTSEFSSTDETWLTTLCNNKFSTTMPVRSQAFLHNSTFPMIPCAHLDKIYDRAEIARIVAKSGCRIKCTKCDLNCGKYAVRCFNQKTLPIISEIPSNYNRSQSDDGCYCSSDISSENSDRRKARNGLTVRSVDDFATETGDPNSKTHSLSLVKPYILDDQCSASFV